MKRNSAVPQINSGAPDQIAGIQGTTNFRHFSFPPCPLPPAPLLENVSVEPLGV